MEEQKKFKKWDIVLITLPSKKKRPALVISPERHNITHDIIVLFITSNFDSEKEFGDFKIEKWQEAQLPKPALVKMNFSTVNQKHMKPLGRLEPEDITKFEKKFRDFFNLN
jgi:hypothetical protein